MPSFTNWKIEPGHSQIQFKVKHLAITNVNGIFKTFTGAVTCPNESFDNATVKVSIDADSIDTQNIPRDNHLKSEHLFDAENYPHLTFEGILKNNGNAYDLNGDLTMRDITKPVNLKAHFTGMATGFAGDERAGFEANGQISRTDFGLTWNIAAEGGGLVIGDAIKLHFDIQLVKTL